MSRRPLVVYTVGHSTLLLTDFVRILVDNEITINTFSDEKIADPVLQETMSKVSNRVVAKAEEGSVDFERGIPIRITLTDGRVLEHATSRQDILGSQHNPWDFENIKAKFLQNAAMVLSEDIVNDAADTWSEITQLTDVAGAIQRTMVKT